MSTTSCPTNALQGKTATQSGRRRRTAIVAAVAVVGFALWYLFRPELLFINKHVNEAFPTANASSSGSALTGRTVAQGMFHGAAHETKGTAAVYELINGNHVLRLTGFETSNGPDVHVLLGKASDASDNATVKDAGYVDLGSMKGNIGDQNYEIPKDVNLSAYNSVTIWCNRFSVNFGTAPLQVN
jgi:Electron transfer DM13